MEPYRALLDIEYNDDYFYSADLVPAQETVDALKEQAAEDMQTIFNNILNGLGYDSVQNLFVNGVGDGNCQEDYEYALQNFQEANLISFTLDQMTVQLDSADSDTITFEVVSIIHRRIIMDMRMRWMKGQTGDISLIRGTAAVHGSF